MGCEDTEFRGIILEVFNVMPGNLDYLLGNSEYRSVVHRFQEADNRRQWKNGQEGLMIKSLNQSVFIKGKPK